MRTRSSSFRRHKNNNHVSTVPVGSNHQANLPTKRRKLSNNRNNQLLYIPGQIGRPSTLNSAANIINRSGNKNLPPRGQMPYHRIAASAGTQGGRKIYYLGLLEPPFGHTVKFYNGQIVNKNFVNEAKKNGNLYYVRKGLPRNRGPVFLNNSDILGPVF